MDFYNHPAFNEGTDLTEIKSKNQSKETVNNFKLNKSSEKLIITLFQLSDSMEHMWRQFSKLKNREGGQFEIPFKFDEEGHTKEPIYEDTELSDFNKNIKRALDYVPKK